MRNYLIYFFSLILLSSVGQANLISKHIKQTDFDSKAQVSVLVYDLNKNKIIFKENSNQALNPASILKLLTFGSSLHVLKSDYKFTTSLYKDCNNDVFIKLGADPLLKQNDLNKLIANLKNTKINNIYIDDSIFLSEKYPPSWLNEDKWPNSSYITPYIIDSNKTQIAIKRSSLSTKIDIIQNDEYKIPIINELKPSDTHNFKIEQPYGEDSLIISLKGNINKDEIIDLPVINPEINFKVKLQKSLDKYNVVPCNNIQNKTITKDAKLIAKTERDIKDIAQLILHNSDNFASEITFRLAASKFYNKSANLDDAINMFNEQYGYLLNIGEKIADSSGVSRENNLSTATISKILLDIINKTNIEDFMAEANQGTLIDRLIFLQGNLKAKTGTMRELSSLAGIIKTRKQNNILFISIVQDSKKRKSLLKHYENNLIGIIYKNY